MSLSAVLGWGLSPGPRPSRRSSALMPTSPDPASSPPGVQEGAAGANSAHRPSAPPHTRGTSVRPGPSKRSWLSSFRTLFPRRGPRVPGEWEDGELGWTQHLGSGQSAATRYRCERAQLPAAVRALRVLGEAPNGGRTVLPGPGTPGAPMWPSSLSAACLPGLDTRVLPLSQWPPRPDCKLGGVYCAGQGTGFSEGRAPCGMEGKLPSPCPRFPHLQNLGVSVRPELPSQALSSTKHR